MLDLPDVPPMQRPSSATTVTFVAIVLTLALLLVFAASRPAAPTEPPTQRRRWAVSTALLASLWLALSAVVPASGILATKMLPPPALLYAVVCVAVAVTAAYCPLGSRLIASTPLAWLIGFQSFRFLLELVLHDWWKQGVLPVQMTFEGRNFDIVSGALALTVGIWAALGRVPRGVVLGFNLIALGLLINVMTIAMLSAPTPLRVYMNEPPVLLPFNFPYAWIVPWCVGGALFGHLLVFRWLLEGPARRGS